MMQTGKTLSFLLILSLGTLLMAACASSEKKEPNGATTLNWEQEYIQTLPALGHRNWIVVADAAFPLQISPGIEVVVSGEDHFVVLEKVLRAVDNSRHIRPKIYLDRELSFVTEDLAPGIDACRARLEGLLEGREVSSVLHEELIARLDEVARTFCILMIKTDLTLPYTSVFMELDCGYWKPEAEARMRERMK